MISNEPRIERGNLPALGGRLCRDTDINDILVATHGKIETFVLFWRQNTEYFDAFYIV